MDLKDKIIAELTLVKTAEQINKNVYKVRAYDRVIQQIQRLAVDVKIRSVADLKAVGVTGIGKSIAQKISDIADNGSLAISTDTKNNVKAYDALTKVHGIGQAKAMELIELGILTIDDLRGRMDLLNDVQRIGLQFYDDLEKRIPRKEMLRHEKVLHESCAKYFAADDCALAGSFRRGAVSSGDIDVLVTGDLKNFKRLINDLKKFKYLTHILALGDKKCMAIVKLPRFRTYRRLDILLTPPEEYPFALLYFTGSMEFNVAVRQRALDRGYSINEHGITALNGKRVKERLRTEADILAFLGIRYIVPTKREIRGKQNIFVD
jgi:DNA polymerase beta